MKVKLLRHLTLFFVFLFLGACGDKNGSLTADLITTNMGANAQNIAKYIATVNSAGGDNLFYPSNCLQDDSGGGKCVTRGCGFDPSGPFSLDITFGSFASGSTVQVTVCSLDSSPSFIGFAQSQAVNSDGQVILLNMGNDTGSGTNSCSQWMPAICP